MYNCQCSWNYLATSHGKGLVDEIGHALKCAVCDMVTSWHVMVTDDGNMHISFWCIHPGDHLSLIFAQKYQESKKH